MCYVVRISAPYIFTIHTWERHLFFSPLLSVFKCVNHVRVVLLNWNRNGKLFHKMANGKKKTYRCGVIVKLEPDIITLILLHLLYYEQTPDLWVWRVRRFVGDHNFCLIKGCQPDFLVRSHRIQGHTSVILSHTFACNTEWLSATHRLTVQHKQIRKSHIKIHVKGFF